jgi:hypothetical protein
VRAPQRLFWKVVAFGGAVFAGWLWDGGAHKSAAGLFLCAIGIVVEIAHITPVERAVSDEVTDRGEAKI